MARTIDELLDEADSYVASSELTFLVGAKIGATGWESLTEVEEDLVLIHCLAEEVANGGFEQFFVNQYGDMAAETLHALKNVGAERGVEMLSEIMKAFSGGRPSPDQDERLHQLELLNDAWRERERVLTEEFWDYSFDVRAQAVEYVRKNRNAFLCQVA